MLRDAAVLHLELLASALDDGLTMKDGYSFNVQWRGSAPEFIDIGSFEQSGGGPWVGYRQFCQTFLYPLMLEAHLGIPFQRYLLGHLDGIEPTEMRRIFARPAPVQEGRVPARLPAQRRRVARDARAARRRAPISARPASAPSCRRPSCASC